MPTVVNEYVCFLVDVVLFCAPITGKIFSPEGSLQITFDISIHKSHYLICRTNKIGTWETSIPVLFDAY